ncbi:MAG: hypothetical protein V2J14_00150 [Erythrobacter sp.]|jgi:hypothetical protein|nr:hypothetical protein [Erythrobacter sp.]
MRIHETIIRPAAILATGAIALTGAASAQVAGGPGVRTSSTPSYHLVQLSVAYDAERIADFAARTQEIRDCGDARELASSYPADFVENKNVNASVLPGDVRALLKDLPTGRASKPFGNVGDKMRVLVICDRNA